MTALAIIRPMGSERVQLVGLLAGGLRPRHIDEDDEEREIPPAERLVGPADVAPALDRGELDSITLEDPGELIRVEGFAEGTVAGSAGYVSSYLLSMLPFGHQVVYLDMVTAVAVVPVDPLDGAEPTEGVVTLYQEARQRLEGAQGRKEPRRRVKLT